MSYSKKQILDALRNVKHPETAQDIVAMGMVDDIWIEGNKAGFTLSFKKPNDPFINSMHKVCIQAIEKHLGKDLDFTDNIKIKTPEKKEPKGTPDAQTMKDVKNIIAVASGKGGVGKTSMTSVISLWWGLTRPDAKIPVIAPSLGGVETLLTRPAVTSHAGLNAEDLKRSGITLTFSHNIRHIPRHIHNRRWLKSTITAINHQIDLVFKYLPNIIRIGERHFLTR